jgi:hypothetical protein
MIGGTLGGCDMSKSLVLLGLVIASTPATTFAQVPPGSRDGTNDVRSQAIGAPGQSTNAVDQYLKRQGLQDLPGQKSNAKLGASRPAKAEELTVGAIVNDKTGVSIAKIEQVDTDGVVVPMGTAKVKVPAEAFGHNKAGLLLDVTKAQFEQVVAQAKTPS